MELGKYGLGRRDLTANVNFFSKVVVDLDGSMQFISAHSRPGSFVELRAEMNVLTILNTCPHPLDPNPELRAPSGEAVRVPRPCAAGDDLCRKSRPENERGFTLTERYFAGACTW